MPLLLTRRYATLNGLPGGGTAPTYLLLRGTLLVAAKVFFSGLPALIVTQSSRAQQLAVYAVCLPLLGVQSFVSTALYSQARVCMEQRAMLWPAL